ncbi:stage II sporulation protein [Peptococcaceae bacterium CEB3]|nr:stage II sporulation protein [Peptococcaceae bacterium CEB3]
MRIKKLVALSVLSCTMLMISVFPSQAATLSTTKFPHAGPNRPGNGTGHSAPVYVTRNIAPSTKIKPEGIPGTHPVLAFPEPSQITVAIYDRNSSGAEDFNVWNGNVTVDFEQYVKDVLPNEWYESWASDGFNSLEAGALAVKTYGWYHTIYPKDWRHGADVTNGTASQMYDPGSGAKAPNCSQAVDNVKNQVIGNYTINSDGSVSTTLLETCYYATTSPGYAMSQWGSYYDAQDGMDYSQIINKWYKNLAVHVCEEIVNVPNS